MHESPHAKLTPAPAKWTEGFWADRFKLCHETIIPSMREALAHPDNSADFRNFRIAAGLEQGEHHGTNWSDGDCYKWMEAMSHVYGVTKDPELAGIFVDMRGSEPVEYHKPGECSYGDQNQDRTPLRDETQAVGHAVTATDPGTPARPAGGRHRAQRTGVPQAARSVGRKALPRPGHDRRGAQAHHAHPLLRLAQPWRRRNDRLVAGLLVLVHRID